MKDEGPKIFKLVKTNSALDFLKNNTLFLIKSKASCFNYRNYVNLEATG